jgi:hypothetical protein
MKMLNIYVQSLSIWGPYCHSAQIFKLFQSKKNAKYETRGPQSDEY